MMTWNYRVVKYAEEGAGYGLHEVYYAKDGTAEYMTKEPASFVCDSDQDTREIFKALCAAVTAFDKDVFQEPKEWAASWESNDKAEKSLLAAIVGVGWIDREERLPDKTDEYLVTEVNEKGDGAVRVRQVRFIKGMSPCAGGFLTTWRVLGWMPMPKPFHPEEGRNNG